MNTNHIAAYAFHTVSHEGSYGCTFFAPSLEEAKELASEMGFRFRFYPDFFMDRAELQERVKMLAETPMPESVLDMMLHDATSKLDEAVFF
ncbi:hypothetical protein MX143_31850 [Pseudomonas aeruginosa]|uniref:hypothetical protein n=1 Tax=Pseudomonas aeruginosa TaxID=287 RepID=UPI001FF16EC2|nr:hypothetical protein [Pseudomonas aeruginosa]MCK0983188.1 hypothetical protein [Pseudomonas aeruginosa]MCL8243588.1 hypothetical protein [Pseudomonas aeruginosa]